MSPSGQNHSGQSPSGQSPSGQSSSGQSPFVWFWTVFQTSIMTKDLVLDMFQSVHKNLNVDFGETQLETDDHIAQLFRAF